MVYMSLYERSNLRSNKGQIGWVLWLKKFNNPVGQKKSEINERLSRLP